MIFKSVLEGLFHYSSCLLCEGHMYIKNEGFSIESHYAKNNLGFNLIFNLEKIDKLIINPSTQEVVIQSFKYNYSECSGDSVYGSGSNIYVPSDHYNYKDCFTVEICCNKCTNFEYAINLFVDLEQKSLIGVQLQRTVFYFKEKNNVYYVQNDYSELKTMLISLVTEEVLLDISLVEINIHNPINFLNRLKKLIIFS